MSVVGLRVSAFALAAGLLLFTAAILAPRVRAGSAVGYGATVTSAATAGIATSATNIEFSLTTGGPNANIRSAVVAIPVTDIGQNTSESVTLQDGQSLAAGTIPFMLGDSTTATLPDAHYDILSELTGVESIPGQTDARATSLGHLNASHPGQAATLVGTLTTAGATLDLVMVLPPTTTPTTLTGGTLTLGATGAR